MRCGSASCQGLVVGMLEDAGVDVGRGFVQVVHQLREGVAIRGVDVADEAQAGVAVGGEVEGGIPSNRTREMGSRRSEAEVVLHPSSGGLEDGAVDPGEDDDGGAGIEPVAMRLDRRRLAADGAVVDDEDAVALEPKVDGGAQPALARRPRRRRASPLARPTQARGGARSAGRPARPREPRASDGSRRIPRAQRTRASSRKPAPPSPHSPFGCTAVRRLECAKPFALLPARSAVASGEYAEREGHRALPEEGGPGRFPSPARLGLARWSLTG